MSHFTVLVIGDNVEEQLKPYQENNMGDCPKEFLKFHDKEDEIRQNYETGTTEKVKLPDGKLVWAWDERFRIPGTIGNGSDTHKIPDDCQKVTVKFTELYSSIEAYAKDYEGYKQRDPDINRYGYWENNDAYMIEIDLGRYGNQNLQGLSENQTHNRILQDQEKTSWSDRRGNVLSLQNVCQDAQSGKNAGASSFLALETEIWNFIRSVCGDVGTAERVMCDLLEATFIETEDARGSLSQIRKDSRITLHALQHSIGTRSRRYKIVTKNDTLSAKAHVSNFYLYKGTKWDWYQVGGRWTGFFPLKPLATGKTGEPGLMTSLAKKGYADQCLLKDIDIKRARDEAEAVARAEFADWKMAFTVHGHGETFEEIRDRICGTDKEKEEYAKVDEARKVFWQQPVVKAYAKILQSKEQHCWEDPIRQFGFDEEAYVQKARNRALTTFAILKNGEWFENGEMGWFGVSHGAKMSDEVWRAHFARLYDELPPDTLMTIVDCHI